jgi:hypothetical protein
MSTPETQREPSAAEIALAKLGVELERVSALYESLAMRVVTLEAASLEARRPIVQRRTAVSVCSHDLSVPQNKTNWLRTLVQLIPKKVRQLYCNLRERRRP